MRWVMVLAISVGCSGSGDRTSDDAGQSPRMVTVDAGAPADTGAADSQTADAMAIDSQEPDALPPAHLVITPGDHDFGTIKTGTDSARFNFTVTNVGGSDFGLIFVGVGGETPGDFPAEDGCAALKKLSPGNHCDVAIRFEPKSEEPRSALLKVQSQQGHLEDMATLAGTGAP